MHSASSSRAARASQPAGHRTNVQGENINHRLARRIVNAHIEWLDEVERELG
jgi:hypothetical protein